MPNKLVNSKDQAHHTCSCSRFPLGCTHHAAQLTLPTSTSMSSELGWARYITKERFLMPRPQLQQAAALVIMLDIHSFRHTGAARKQMASKLATGSSSSTAVADGGPHAPRSSTRARIAATSNASDATNGIGRCARCVENLI